VGLIVLFGSFFLLVALGIPIAFCLGIAALIGFLYEGIPALVAFQRIQAGMESFTLLAIPFFIFAGELMQHGGIADRLVRFASAMVGRIRGGLGVVNVLTSMLFGGISGSAVADTSALGSIFVPMMKRKGYHGDYAVNVAVTSSIAGVLIPPSHNMIIYSLAAGGGVSIGVLFVAGVLPGILMCLCLAVCAYLVAIRRNYPREDFPGFALLLLYGVQALPGLMTAIIILGGILLGIFTVTESAAIGAIYALLVTVLVYRGLGWREFTTATASAVRTTAMVMVLIGSASAFGYMLSHYRVAANTAQFLTQITDNPILLLLLINLILLVLGAIMDMAALILITTPIFLPVVVSLGVDPVQFGMILLMNLGLGLCTPPVGACLFVGCAVGGERMETVIKTIWPFYAAIVVALLLTTYVPAISLWLPGVLYGYGS
jgi:tripartite ATP-independent transporter DctM subunit